MDDVIQDKLVTGLTDTATTIERAGTRYKQSATYCPFQGSRKHAAKDYVIQRP